MFQPFQPFHKTIWLLPTLLLVAVSVEGQQPKKIARIGLLISASTAVTAPYVEAFREGMRELGYVEGKNYDLEIRGGGAQPDRLAHLAADLVALKLTSSSQ